MIDLPSLFPSDLFSESQEQIFKKLIKDTVIETSDIFFSKLTSKSPLPSEIKIASDALKNKLTDTIESNYWIETICGEESTSDQRGYLRYHLRRLIPQVVIPDLSHTQSEVRLSVLMVVTAVSTALGLCLGNVVSQLGLGLGLDIVTQEVGLMFGAIIGAVIGVFFVMYVAANEKLRNGFLLGLGLVAGTDLTIYLVRNMSIILRGSVLSIIKRFVFYGGLAIITLISKRRIVFNRNNYRKEIEIIIEQWLHAVLMIFTVLTYKINTLEQNPFNRYAQDKDRLNTIVSIVRRLEKAAFDVNSDSDSDLSESKIIIKELVQELESCGFSISEETDSSNLCNDNSELTPEAILIWDEFQNKFFDSIGIIRNGDHYQVVEEPIIRNEIVERKGIARKRNKIS
ncbi:MAG: hypothetical protein LBE18_06455 [Planctomycetaceae bacterium]|jgi:hypothetical protein|nr:hypothetical protein [Planctomycetaceae bacterium]